jgi:magnesium transporter
MVTSQWRDTSPGAHAAGRIVAAVRTRLYRHGRLAMENFPVSEISEHLGAEDCLVWLDLRDPTPEDFELVGQEFGLHELAVEDALTRDQRPKVDRYATHLFLSAYGVVLEPGATRLDTSEIGVFVTRNAVITVRTGDAVDIEEVVARWDSSPDLVAHGVGFLLYALLDHVVDGHFAAVQRLDDGIEELEDALFADDRRRLDTVQRRSFELRKNLVLLRRVVLPMREVVNALMRRDLDVVAEPMLPYYLDVYDHVLRVTEWTESLRDLVTTVLETNLTIQGNRLNLIMKKVTSWAAIIAVPTAITGFYGQNLPYPGFATYWGFLFSTALILVLSSALYVTFRHRDWL